MMTQILADQTVADQTPSSKAGEQTENHSSLELPEEPYLCAISHFNITWQTILYLLAFLRHIQSFITGISRTAS